MKHIAPALIVSLLMTFQAAANPNEAPDIVHLVEAEIGDDYRVVEVTVGVEDLRRDGLEATYYAEFEAALALPVALFHEVGRGEGYILVDKVLDRGEIFLAHGNAVAAYQEGRWLVEVNVLDLRLPGGRPFPDFRNFGAIVLEAGTDHVARFQAGREAALADAEALRMQDLRIKDAELRLEDKLRREREVLAAQREAEAKAAQELAEIEAGRRVAEARTALIAEQEADLKASDEMIFSRLASGSEHALQFTHEGQRVQGTLRMTESSSSHASGQFSVALGNGNSYQSHLTMTAADEPGQVMATYIPIFSNWTPSNGTCMVRGSFSKQLGIVTIEGDPDDRRSRGCHMDRIVIDLNGEG